MTTNQPHLPPGTRVEVEFEDDEVGKCCFDGVVERQHAKGTIVNFDDGDIQDLDLNVIPFGVLKKVPSGTFGGVDDPDGHLLAGSKQVAMLNGKKVKGAKSAYVFFCGEPFSVLFLKDLTHLLSAPPFHLADKRDDIKNELTKINPDVRSTDVTKRSAELWKELSEDQKRPFVDMATLDKQRYKEEMAVAELADADGLAPEKPTKKRKKPPPPELDLESLSQTELTADLVFNLNGRNHKNKMQMDAVVRLFYSQSREKDMETGEREEDDLMQMQFGEKKMYVWTQLRKREAALRR
jgi:hypothetical protein